MMVTAITTVDKRKSKVFLEEGFAFVLYRGEVERFDIEAGKDLEEAVYQRILSEVLCPRARERALYLLQASARTEAWMRKKLLDGGYPREAADQALDFLKEYRFIDDRAYAQSYVRSFGEKKSLRQIIYDLKQKGVSGEYIQEACSRYEVDDDESARQLLAKKMKGKKELSFEEKRRLSSCLGRKGYSYETISRVMRELLNGCDQE